MVSDGTEVKGGDDPLVLGVYVDEGIINSAEHPGIHIRWSAILRSRIAGQRSAWREADWGQHEV